MIRAPHLRTHFVLATALAAATLSAGAARVATAQSRSITSQRIDTTFAFNKASWVDISVTSGTIIVTGWTRPEARVVARIDNGTFDHSFSGGRITLSARPQRNQRNRNNQRNDVYIEVSVPIGTRVMATASSGDVRVRGTTAEVQVRTSSGNVEVVDAADFVDVVSISGDIRLDRIRARTRIGTTSGDLELDGITGDLEIRSVSSDMVIRRVESSDVRIGTTSGDISYEGSIDPKGKYDINSHSGDVVFEMPAGIGASLSLQSYSGDIESAFPMTLQPGESFRRIRGRRMEFTVGAGGARVSITTFSGDITIERGPNRPPRQE